MNENGITTKEKILQVSLELFSRRGYSAVSIRDICGKVGIKESSVYYHFKSKRDIYDVLCSSFTQNTYALPEVFVTEMQKTTSIKEEEFLFVCRYFFNDYLMNKDINRFIRMLIIEQSDNQESAALYHKVLYDDALTNQKFIFKWLIDIGFLINADVERITLDYYMPVVYLFHRYLAAGEITEDVRVIANECLSAHIRHFLDVYKKA